MTERNQILAQLPHTLLRTDLPGLGTRTEGKVRDLYATDDRLVLIATDRLSAFDRVLSTVPFKGDVLTRIALHWFEETRDIVANHILDAPDPSVMVVRRCQPLPVEVIVRGYITGSLWRDYQAGRAGAYGIALPDGLSPDQPFDTPILTPTTKADVGDHDAPISREEILAQGLVSEALWTRIEEVAFALYARGVERAEARGLILVDTKYEFGLDPEGELVLIDEVHTPDSSRYWIADEYETRRREGRPQRMLDKENIRQWLVERGFQGEGEPPEIPDPVRADLAETYLDVHQRLTGRPLDPEIGPVAERIRRNLLAAGYAVEGGG